MEGTTIDGNFLEPKTTLAMASIYSHFQDYVQQHLLKYEIEQFAYIIINKRTLESPLIFSNYPKKWIKMYREQKLHLQDPIVNFAFHSIVPFSWSEMINNLSTKERIFINKAEKYYLKDGYYFSLNDMKGNLAILKINNCYVEQPQHFRMLIDRQKADLQMLLVELQQAYLANFSQQINRMILTDKQITAREKEILRWSSNGKTYMEISLILGITERTVKFHMANIVKKLGVNNAKHAIYRAHELDLF